MLLSRPTGYLWHNAVQYRVQVAKFCKMQGTGGTMMYSTYLIVYIIYALSIQKNTASYAHPSTWYRWHNAAQSGVHLAKIVRISRAVQIRINRNAKQTCQFLADPQLCHIMFALRAKNVKAHKDLLDHQRSHNATRIPWSSVAIINKGRTTHLQLFYFYMNSLQLTNEIVCLHTHKLF